MVDERVCAFQIYEDTESSGVSSCGLVRKSEDNFNECNPPFCPHYQTWKLLEKLVEKI